MYTPRSPFPFVSYDSFYDETRFQANATCILRIEIL